MSQFMYAFIVHLDPLNFSDALPNSLRDSNVNPKLKTAEEQGVGACSLARNTIEG
jgi:hypothetical protein